MELSPDRLVSMLVLDEKHNARLNSIVEDANRLSIPVRRCSRRDLDRGAKGIHQGVIAEVLPAAPLTEEQFRERFSTLEAPAFLLVLDGVQDPHNLGACLRSADGAGVQAVIAPKDKAVGLTSAVRKVASGAAETVPFVQVTNLARTLRWLKERGVWLIGTADDASERLYDIDLTGAIGLVMGGEGRGLRRLTREHCDYLVRLPMRGVVESLNVSVATGICLYEAVRQRG